VHSSSVTVHAQSETATLSGTVMDQAGAVVPGVNIAVISVAQGFHRNTITNDDGVFIVPSLPPGRYIVKAEREGFSPTEQRNVILNVNSQVAIKIYLKIGDISQTVEIVDAASLIDLMPSVSTLVDQQFVSNLPLNGRSFQPLLSLTPGVVLTKSNSAEAGQFSVNGQRANANYFLIDGVSANIGAPVTPFPGQLGSGSLPGLTASGGTNNLVSIDALQEFKVLTSTFAPEFGRTPGAQISIATRSGTNEFHGSLFNYFRNEALDANDWFGNFGGLKKAALRQNDFGGVFGGPILLPRFGEGGRQPGYNGRNRSFFFFSYEGLRLRLPQTAALMLVPSLAARESAAPQIKPFVEAFPLPNGPDAGNGFAFLSASYSDPSTLNATSIRIDHTINQKLSFFGRYNYAPSETITRGGRTLSSVNYRTIKTQTLTVGTTFFAGHNISNDLRVNFSRNEGKSFDILDDFGGAKVPDVSVFFPQGFSSENARFTVSVASGSSTSFNLGKLATTVQRQFNIVNGLSILSGNHQFKFGGDYRRMFPIVNNLAYSQVLNFNGIGVPGSPASSSVLSGRIRSAIITAGKSPLAPTFNNLSLYAQDSWKINPRTILTYGLRWEYVPPPYDAEGNQPAALQRLQDGNFSLVTSGGDLWKTTYNNFAPRIGLSYRLSQDTGRETVMRGGVGIFYDLGDGPAANAFASSFPFVTTKRLPLNTPYPLSASNAAPPVFATAPTSTDFLFVFDPNLKLPRVYQWNVAVEQSLGPTQSISASYVAAVGRRLLRLEKLGPLTPPIAALDQSYLTNNTATSDYHAMQLQFQRRLSRGLQALASYTWSHSIDIASSDSKGIQPGALNKTDPTLDRGPSDFDVRHAFTSAVTYNIPVPNTHSLGNAVLRNWAIDSIVIARSATPVDVIYTTFTSYGIASLRPDLITGQPLYLADPTVAGGRRINRAAFVIPTTQRQGTLSRNALRGFGAWQVDFAVRRQFKLKETTNLQFRAEFFNIFNHPNFADPGSGSANTNSLTDANFGKSVQMLGRGLGASTAGLNALYQIGGPRSIQLSLKLQF
jgi:hypothetical protein